MKSEPHTCYCPICKDRYKKDVKMKWDPWQGPGTGGWKCPDCGLKLDCKD